MRKILCVTCTHSPILIYVRNMVRYVDFKSILNTFQIGHLTFYASFESKNRLIQSACFNKKRLCRDSTGHIIKKMSGTTCTDDTRVKVPSINPAFSSFRTINKFKSAICSTLVMTQYDRKPAQIISVYYRIRP